VQAFSKIPTKGRKLIFLARHVPPVGYKTFYLTKHRINTPDQTPKASAEGCENEFYRVSLAPGGIKSIFDKKTNCELLKSNAFLGGEVFTMNSYAPRMPDAGEAGAVIQPIMDHSFDRVSSHAPEWKVLETGPVRTVFGMEQPLADTTVNERVIVLHQLPRVDCKIDLADFNGRLWREYRMALPLASDRPKLTYEVPMGVVEIGKDEIPTTGGHAYGSLTYAEQCRGIRPRVVQNFIDASDGQSGLTLTTDVSVFDWKDPTGKAPAETILQPVLLASRRSCNGSGNWYPQAGDHEYAFSITSHVGGWRNGWRPGIAANHPLTPVFGAKPAAGASLPSAMSFVQISSSNVVLSTLKKCEDDDTLVARVYDVEGKDSNVELRLFVPTKAATQTDLIEEEGRPLRVREGGIQIDIGHHAIETMRIVPEPRQNKGSLRDRQGRAGSIGTRTGRWLPSRRSCYGKRRRLRGRFVW
jgi:alpha-mannosidase